MSIKQIAIGVVFLSVVFVATYYYGPPTNMEPAYLAFTEDGCMYAAWRSKDRPNQFIVVHSDGCKNTAHPWHNATWVMEHSRLISKETVDAWEKKREANPQGAQP